MKIILRLLFIPITVLAMSCSTNNDTSNTETANNEVEASVAKSAVYGEDFTKEGAIDIKMLNDKLGESDSLDIKLVGTINSTCAVKGCWMKVATSESDEVRVSFKDYGFFVPKSGVEGKTAVINGYAKKVITDVETLKHFAQDAGKSQEEIDAITEPKEEISFVASGVIIEETE